MELSDAQFRAQFSLSRPIAAPTLCLVPSIVPAPSPPAFVCDSLLKPLFESRAVPSVAALTYPVPCQQEAQWNFEEPADSISSQPWIFTTPTPPLPLYPSNSYSSQYSGYPQESSPFQLPLASKSPTNPLNSLSGPSLCLPTPTAPCAAWLGPPLCPPSPTPPRPATLGLSAPIETATPPQPAHLDSIDVFLGSSPDSSPPLHLSSPVSPLEGPPPLCLSETATPPQPAHLDSIDVQAFLGSSPDSPPPLHPSSPVSPLEGPPPLCLSSPTPPSPGFPPLLSLPAFPPSPTANQVLTSLSPVTSTPEQDVSSPISTPFSAPAISSFVTFEASTHALRNTHLFMQATRKNAPVSEAMKASRKLRRELDIAANTSLAEDFGALLERHRDETEALAKQHGKTVEYLEKLRDTSSHYKQKRAPSLQNALVHAKAIEVNSSKILFIFLRAYYFLTFAN